MTILAVDLGTSAIKFLRADAHLRVQSVDRVPATGLNVDSWLDALRRTIGDYGDGPAIEAIAITGQMHGLMTWEGVGFGDGIPWTDQRAAPIAATLNNAFDPESMAHLGGPLASGFLGVSLAWVRNQDPDRWRRIRHVMLPKDALLYALTRQHVTDPTDAAGSGLLDVATGTWNDGIVGHIGIPRNWLPRIVPSGTDIGAVAPCMATKLGLSSKTRVVIAGGDAPIGAFGAGIAREGEALLLLSSGAQIIMPWTSFAPDRDGRWYTWPAVNGGFLRVGTLLNAGNAISWVRRTLGDVDLPDEDPTSLIALPYLLGERTPLGDADLRGAILGLTPDTAATEIAGAMSEGVAYAIRHALDAMSERDDPPKSIRLGGGGANIPGWQQIITDVLGIATRRIASSELTALGAAALAANATPTPELEPEVSPHPDRTARYDARYEIYREALAATQAISHRLTALAREERR